MSVYNPLHLIPSNSSDPASEYRKYLYLRLLAEHFEYELKLERCLQLELIGSGQLPDEWRAYRLRELQNTWDKVHRYELNHDLSEVTLRVRDEESRTIYTRFLLR